LPTIIKPKHQKRGKTRNKMEKPMSKNANEPPKRMNHKGNIKFPNPFLSQKNIKYEKGRTSSKDT
jgi:hypothetical protein